MRSRSVPLLPLSPRQQLRAGRLPRRLTQLVVGLMLYGASMAMMIRGQLGQDPWDAVAYALLIGPIVQLLLPRLTVRLAHPDNRRVRKSTCADTDCSNIAPV